MEKAGIRAVLTGGACASIYTEGSYQSVDLDFVLQGSVLQTKLDDAMSTVGFRRLQDRYVHPVARFYVEFPPGPLTIGGDHQIQPIERTVGRLTIRLLSPTDSCRDRLAAFFHWRDQQSLRTAVAIALRTSVDLERIRDWSVREGAPEGFESFLRALEQVRSPIARKHPRKFGPDSRRRT